MTKKTKKALVIYGGVAAVGLVGYLYWKSKQPTTPPAVVAAHAALTVGP